MRRALIALLILTEKELPCFRVVMTDVRGARRHSWGFQEADNASPTPANSNYREPALRTPPTSVRLGLRVSF